jgi:hypothetical protein
VVANGGDVADAAKQAGGAVVNAGVSKEDAAAIAGEAAGAASEAAKAQVRMRTLGMKLGSLLEQEWWLQVDRMRMLQRQLPMQHGKTQRTQNGCVN